MPRVPRKVLLATMATLVSLQTSAQEPPKMKMTTEVPPGIATRQAGDPTGHPETGRRCT